MNTIFMKRYLPIPLYQAYQQALLVNKTFVMPFDQLAFDLLHRLQRYPDEDQKRCSTDRDLIRQASQSAYNHRQDRDDRKEERTAQRDPVQDPHDIFHRRLSRSYAW